MHSKRRISLNSDTVVSAWGVNNAVTFVWAVVIQEVLKVLLLKIIYMYATVPIIIFPQLMVKSCYYYSI